MHRKTRTPEPKLPLGGRPKTLRKIPYPFPPEHERQVSEVYRELSKSLTLQEAYGRINEILKNENGFLRRLINSKKPYFRSIISQITA